MARRSMPRIDQITAAARPIVLPQRYQRLAVALAAARTAATARAVERRP